MVNNSRESGARAREYTFLAEFSKRSAMTHLAAVEGDGNERDKRWFEERKAIRGGGTPENLQKKYENLTRCHHDFTRGELTLHDEGFYP